MVTAVWPHKDPSSPLDPASTAALEERGRVLDGAWMVTARYGRPIRDRRLWTEAERRRRKPLG
jgi:hypothetical protein